MNLDQIQTRIDHITDAFETGETSKKQTKLAILALVIESTKQTTLKNSLAIQLLKCGDIDNNEKFEEYINTKSEKEVHEFIHQLHELKNRRKRSKSIAYRLGKLIDSAINTYEQRFGVWVPF